MLRVAYSRRLYASFYHFLVDNIWFVGNRTTPKIEIFSLKPPKE